MQVWKSKIITLSAAVQHSRHHTIKHRMYGSRLIVWSVIRNEESLREAFISDSSCATLEHHAAGADRCR